jgi:hypothetical protein
MISHVPATDRNQDFLDTYMEISQFVEKLKANQDSFVSKTEKKEAAKERLVEIDSKLAKFTRTGKLFHMNSNDALNILELANIRNELTKSNPYHPMDDDLSESIKEEMKKYLKGSGISDTFNTIVDSDSDDKLGDIYDELRRVFTSLSKNKSDLIAILKLVKVKFSTSTHKPSNVYNICTAFITLFDLLPEAAVAKIPSECVNKKRKN